MLNRVDATIGDLLRQAAAQRPDGCALVWATADPEARRRWTYASLLADAEAVAGWLLRRFEPGDRLALWAPSRPEWVQLQLGAALAGVVLVPLNPAFRAPEAGYVLGQSKAAGVVFQAEHRGHPIGRLVEEVAGELPSLRHILSIDEVAAAIGAGVRSSLPAVSPGDVAQIQYTSGTTGTPKGAVLLHRGFTGTIRMAVEAMELGANPVWLNVMPLFHIGGCGLSTIGPIALGGTHVLAERFDPTVVLQLIEQERATFFGSVPTMLLSLLAHPAFSSTDLSSLRVVLSGGAPVAPSLVRRIEETLGVSFLVAYGQTEAHGHVTQTRPADSDEDKAFTVGRALPGIELQVTDPLTGGALRAGAVGELWIRGPTVMGGYYDKPLETAEAFGPDGWLRSGDLCSMDERGVVSFAGRVTEMINRGGENIHPREIEEVIGAHPAVAEAAVLGVPDDYWGEEVAAAVCLRPGTSVTEADLVAYVEARLAPHKVPRSWRFVDELPHTASGKVQKFVLLDGWKPPPLSVDELVSRLLDRHDPATTSPGEFWDAQFDLGLAWVHFPAGHGGVGAPSTLQETVNHRLAAAGAPSNALLNFVGLGLVAPALVAHGTEAQKHRFLRPLFTCEEVWCQLFSEPGAGSDLASLSTEAQRDGDEWVINGHKVWTTMGHLARWGILVARSEPERPKRQGLTFFLVDMRSPGVDVAPLRQMSGEAEFSEVKLHNVRVPDAMRLGEPGGGWRVLISTLMSERAHNGELAMRRQGQGPIAHAVRLWQRQRRSNPVRQDQLTRLWIDVEVIRLTALRADASRRNATPGPEGSILKLATGQLPQRVYEFCSDLLGPYGLLISDYDMVQPEEMGVGNMGDGSEDLDLTKALLNSRSATIGGGTTEIQRNTIAERVLGLPKEPSSDR